MSGSEILVAGTGPAGLIAALALAERGLQVHLVGPDTPGSDKRTVALMQPALAFLHTLGVRDRLEASGTPLRAMRLVDATGALFRSPTVMFHAAEIDEPYFGLNIPNAHLVAVLSETVRAHRAISWTDDIVRSWSIDEKSVTAHVADGTAFSARLAVAADGRNSPARGAAGISVRERSLPQSALVLNFGHSRDHGFVSTEFHTSSGPFTQVPLPGRRSSLVWVVRPEMATTLAELSDGDLSQRIEIQMQSMLGKVAVEPGCGVFPLRAITPERFAQNRIALVGEAAHVFPPISAQGLNLGIRDVKDLLGTIANHPADPGAPEALARYDAKRRPDILARSSSVNLLNDSLLSRFPAAQLARSAGLAAISRFSPLRAIFMREGLEPGSGLATLKPFRGKDRAAEGRW